MKRFICTLIVAVMLIGILPLTFASAAEITYTSISLNTPTSVSVSRDNVEKKFTFTAPEDAYYAFYSIGDCDTYGYLLDVTDDSVIDSNDDAYKIEGYNFYIEFWLNKGEKINLMSTLYNFTRKGTFNVLVDKCGDAESIVPDNKEIEIYVGESTTVGYSFRPLSSWYQNVTLFSADNSIVSVSGDSINGEKVGSTKVTLESEFGLSATVNVKVIAPQKLELNKKVTASGKREHQFSFTPAKTGYYTIFSDFVCDGYVWTTAANAISAEGDAFFLEKGTEYIIWAEDYSGKCGLDIVIQESKVAKEIALYHMGPLYAGQTASFGVDPLDGVLTEEVVYTSSDPSVVEIMGDYVNLNKVGTATITAKAGTATDSLVIEVKKIGQLTPSAPYTENVDAYDSFMVEFTATKDGVYRISAEDVLDSTVCLGYDYDYYYNYVDITATAGVPNYINVYREDYYGDEESGNIKLTAQELKKPTGLKPAHATYNVVVDQEIHIDLISTPEVCAFDSESSWVSSDDENTDIYTYSDKSASFIAYAPGTYTVTFMDGTAIATATINVKEPEALTFGKEKKQAEVDYVEEYVYTFTPKTTGVYAIKSVSDTYLDISVWSNMHNCSNSNKALSLVAGIKYIIEIYPYDEGEFTFKIDKPEYATGIEFEDEEIFFEVGTHFWADSFYTIDGDNSEYAETVTFSNPDLVVPSEEEHAYYAIKPGETTLEVVTENGLKAKMNIIIFPKKSNVENIELSKEELILEVGKSEQLEITVTPQTNSKIYWRSDDESVVRVDDNGRVTAVSEGYAYVYAIVDGSFAVCPVTTVTPKMVDSSKVFTDIKAGKWYTKAIDHAYSYGFIAGVSKTEFGLNTPVTRGMFITILARIAGVDTSSAANKAATTKFTDVKAGKYYTAAIKWASENGVVNGLSKDTFGPNANIERQQICVMLVNFADYMGITMEATADQIKFADESSISKYAKKAVATCQLAEIVSGYNNAGTYTFKPKATATRGEAAQMLYKFHTTFILK